MTLLTAVPEGPAPYDLCVMGAGPVGLALALEAASRGLLVLVVDAGHANPAESPPDWTGSERVHPAHHAPLELATHVGLAGTTWLWGGRCVPYEAVDFEARPQVPQAGWPLSEADIAPWYPRAARYVGCGSAEFRRPLPPEAAASAVSRLRAFDLTQLERWSHQPRLLGSLGQQALAAERVHLLLQTRVEALHLNPALDAVQSLQVRRDGQSVPLNARAYVLAGGALGTTQLLLQTQARYAAQKALFGGPDGPLGRYYMGHIMGCIARVVLKQPADVQWLDFSQDADGTYLRRRWLPTPATQRANGLLNTSFYIDNPPFYDHRHGNPTLSAVFLGLAIAPIGRRLVAEAMRLKHIGRPPYRWGAHSLNILRRPWRAGLDVVDILRHRYLSPVRKPGFVLRSPGGVYALDYHAEQAPNPDSRLTLKNAEGDLRVDFKYLPQDIESVLKAHELLDQDLRAAGLGHLEYERPPEERYAHVFEQASDGFHQIGTTRMSADPAQGVVDADGRVHGLANLGIASSSVFSTSGEANPTLTAVALGCRQAHFWADLWADHPSAAPSLAPSKAHPMRLVQLPGTRLQVSRLVFGTASLHHLARESDRLALLQAAIEAGFSHVDTSPLYGFGLAEASLGALPAELARRITVTTKVGLYGPPGARASVPELYARKVLGKAFKGLNRAVVDWQLARARQSFEDSLRRLRRSEVDVLLLHEPVADLIAGDEWLAWLQSLQQAGRIRDWGVAGEAPAVAAMLQQHPALTPVVQVRDSLSRHQADVLKAVPRPLQFTYGYLADPASAAQPVAQRLRQALQRNAEGAILVSTRRLDRVQALAQCAD
ncbi:aldo/keto reductase [Curvibacter sp. HBC28]|uniref:Aldo/keto reductase n=1 Tax=Curvibacter microcysteis TaxID=3026419 RepID=A0ABT5MGZ4_9BURK|nr:aldo/keto reductase [Curvibacter sp. HBC28]MDD0815691.1 aldo/keto reductase [Curvibacter sp. HBC28]